MAADKDDARTGIRYTSCTVHRAVFFYFYSFIIFSVSRDENPFESLMIAKIVTYLKKVSCYKRSLS